MIYDFKHFFRRFSLALYFGASFLLYFFFVNPYPLREPWQCFMLAMAFFISFPIIHLTLRGFIQLYLSKPEYLNACLCVCMCVECLIILL